VVALVIAWLMLAEMPTWLQLLGAAAIVGGTILVRLGRIERPVVAPAE
jgi:drug/metabolite transporter (DMT)-like permease